MTLGNQMALIASSFEPVSLGRHRRRRRRHMGLGGVKSCFRYCAKHGGVTKSCMRTCGGHRRRRRS